MDVDEEALHLVPVEVDFNNEFDGEKSDDDEECERNRNELELALLEFCDEARITHDTLPESDDEDNWDWDGKGDRGKARGQRNRGQSESTDFLLNEEMVFFNVVGFKDAVVKYAISTGYNLRQYRYDKMKCAYKCVGGKCGWRVYCSRTGRKDEWRIRVFHKVHSCSPNGECKMIKVPVIARLFLDRIRSEPEYYMPAKMEEVIKSDWKVRVSRFECQAARKKALKWIEREYEEQFARLHDYGAEIMQANPNSTVDIETVKNAEGKDEFSRFYVCFDQLKRSWKATCRRLIGLDACHMRGKMKGQVLVAIGRDGNNQIYPVAWGCVQVENTENWKWFLRKLSHDLDLGEGENYIVISDRQKGLRNAVETVIPFAEHRMCVRHIYANLKTKIGKNPYMKPLVWTLAWSYNEAEYMRNLENIEKHDPRVYAAVLKEHPHTWCRAFYKIGNCCEDVENNSVESFNASIAKARGKSFVPMLETIRRLAMVRISKRYEASMNHKGLCTPYVEDFLARELDTAAASTVTRSTNGLFEVVVSGCAFRVNLEARTCTCRRFEICGIPCAHAYAVIIYKKLEPQEYVASWFRTATWRRTYAEGLVPLRGAAFWPSTDESNVYHPQAKPQPGRPKDNKRRKGVNESPTKHQRNKKRTMHCSVCGEVNHNSRFHKGQACRQIVVMDDSQVSSQVTSSQVSDIC